MALTTITNTAVTTAIQLWVLALIQISNSDCCAGITLALALLIKIGLGYVEEYFGIIGWVALLIGDRVSHHTNQLSCQQYRKGDGILSCLPCCLACPLLRLQKSKLFRFSWVVM